MSDPFREGGRPGRDRRDPRTAERVGIGASATGAVLFGSSYVATAFVLRSFPPLGAAAWRGLLATLALGIVLGAGGLGPRPSRPTGPQLARLIVLALTGGLVFIVLMNTAVQDAGPTIPSFVAGLYAVLAAVLAPVVLREGLSRAAVIGFVLALVGTLLLAELHATSSTLTGVLVGLGAAVSYALFLVLSRRWSVPWRLSGPVVTFGTVVATGVPLAAWLLATDPAALLPAHPRTDALLALGWLAIFPGVVAVTLIVIGVQRLDARRSSAFLLLNPVAAALLSWLLLGEGLSPSQFVGAALVLAGIASASGAVSWAASSVRDWRGAAT